MKKILLSTVVLFCFSISIILFQISCKKSADASTTPQTTSDATQQNKIIYLKNFTKQISGQSYDYGEIWTANYDGGNSTKINVQLSPNVLIAIDQLSISPDRKLIFFSGYTPSQFKYSLYSCNIDGSGVKQIVDGSQTDLGIGNVVAY